MVASHTLPLFLWLLLGCCHGIIVQVHDSVVMETDRRYLSFNLDSDEFTAAVRFGRFNFSSVKIRTLMKGLSPAILRVGGSPADWLLFDVSPSLINRTGLDPTPVVMSKHDWENLVTLTLSTGTDLLFDLNLQLRYGDQWDPSNALSLMDYTQSRGWGTNVNFELGNEPDAYPGRPTQFVTLSGKQVAADFKELRKLMNMFPNLKKSFLVGPDVIGGNYGLGKDIIEGLAKYAADDVDAITVHQYYFKGGDPSQWTEFIYPPYFGTVIPNYINDVHMMIRNQTSRDIPVWIGETADCWHSGTLNVTNRYISGFLWLDKLGQAAKVGVKVVMRQTFYGHYYGLINLNTTDPNPDYWLSLVYKRLVGQRVLDYDVYESIAQPNSVKVYVHCTQQGSGYPPGAITLYALNINQNITDILVVLGDLATQFVDVYLMTPADPQGPLGLFSPTVALNGHVLHMIDDHTLPELVPHRQHADTGIKLPPLTYGFFVFPNASFTSCM